MLAKLITFIRQYPFVKQVLKFCIVGGSAALINFSLYYSLINFFRWWYVAASAFGFASSAFFNFAANKLWTFRNKEAGLKMIYQAIKFLLVMISGLAINSIIIYLLVDWYLLDYRLAWLGATAAVTFWSFGGNRFWTFRHQQADLSLPRKYNIIDSDN